MRSKIFTILGMVPVFAFCAGGCESSDTKEQLQAVSEAFTDVASASDATFFGAWNGSTWTTVGRLDYSIAGLSTVQADVKSGNYAQAKTHLLSYFRARTTRQVAPYATPDAARQFLALLEADDFYFTGGETPLASIPFTTTPAWVSTTVTDSVTASLEGGQVSFMLMARTHSSNAVNIDSREGSNPPQLVVNFVGGGQQTLNPSKDAFIRGGTDGNTNFGSDPALVVKEDTGAVVSGNTRRSYLTFDLSSLSGSNIASASLALFGAANTGPFDVVVMSTGNSGYAEGSITWNNTIGSTYSWTGISGGTDWNRPSGSQNEFAYSISRFDFAPDLAATYLATSTESYANNLIRIWLDFISNKGNANPLYTRRLDTALRADNTVPAYHAIRNSTSMDSGANAAILKSFWETANVLSLASNFPVNDQSSNWGLFEARGLYEIALYFPEFTASSGWATTAKSRLDTVMGNLVQADGSFLEADTGYAAGAAETARGVKVFGALNGDSFNSTFDDRLQKLGQYIMDFSRPDGTETPIGDSDPVEVASEALSLSASYPARSDLLYFGSYGAQGTLPGHTSSCYSIGKTAFMKTGYSANDLFMSVDLNDGTHAHPDLNAVTLYAYGQDLLVDPGRYNYDSADPVSTWLRTTTQAHNTIEIDGTAQTTSNNPNTVPRSVDAWSSNALFDFFAGQHSGYSNFVHYRDAFFSRASKFWIVSDYVAAPAGTHSYNQTWHLLPTANAALSAGSNKVTTSFASGANLQIVPVDPGSMTASLQNGYFSPRQFSYSQAKYASYVKNISGSPTFDTVLFPTQAVDTGRDVQTTRLATTPSVPTTTATALQVELDHGHAGNLGYYYLSHENTPSTARSFGNYNFNGKLAYVETTASGGYVSAAVKGGSLLKDGATTLVSSPTAINDVGVGWLSSGAVLDIEGSSLIPDTSSSTAIAVYAPTASAVTLNGVSVPFTKVGNYVYAARVVTGYTPTDDAYVRGGVSANDNFAVEQELLVKRDSGHDNERRSYLKFDFSSFTGTVTSAKLRLHTQDVASDASRTIKVYATSDFSENTVKYNTAPATSMLLGSWTIANTDANKWFQLDVSSYVASAGKTVMFFLVNEGSSSSNNTVVFESKDNSLGVNKPMLVIN